MNGIFDWLSTALFAWLALLFLARSTGPRRPRDEIWRYLPPAAGCMLANQLGNRGAPLVATFILVAVTVSIIALLRPGMR